ncbi:MAG: hypothetical protein HY840_09705 [Bacteroidetes bacterium]|nr:hypothetical protein [Bacteroidota bacterium]
MNINRHNCEAFFLDYYEGNLSPVKVGEMLLFLEENSELKELFQEYENSFLAKENILFPGKEAMKNIYNAEGIEALLSSEVTTDNCEQFFIAFIEGQLSAERTSRMNVFLSANQSQEKEFELFKQCKLSAEKISFEHKQSLKQECITKENREEYFIRAIENDLNTSEQKELKLFLYKNLIYKQEFDLFSKTILVAKKISFEGKANLKRRERKTIFISLYSQRRVYYAAAASILLLAGLFFFYRENENTSTYFADKINPVNKTIVIAQKETLIQSVKKNEQESILEIKEYNNIKHKTKNAKQVYVKMNVVLNKSEIQEENIQLQPVLSEDITEEKLIAQKEELRLTMMQEETILTQTNHPEEKRNIVNENSSVASVKNLQNKSDDYQTVSVFVTKKIRSLLGIKNTNPCTDSDKLGWWDLAMVAKNGVQKITGTKAIDVNKICDGTGNKIEYVFVAGNFEIRKSADKKNE